jgi:hypothetical protein
VHRSGRSPSSGGRATVLSVHATVGPRCTARPALVHRACTRCTGLTVENYFVIRIISEILQRGPWTLVKSTRGPDFADFALKPLGFFEINPRSMIFVVRSEIQKIFTKRSLASEKIHKNSPQNFKNSYLSSHNSKSSDSCAKILRITSYFFLCIHITHVCCILLIDCMCLLHDR